jgi:pilus assembly protein Flp/PilA
VIAGFAEARNQQDRPMPRLRAYCSIIAGQSRAFAGHQKGATAVEYAMIAAGIAGAIIATVVALGTKVTELYESVSAAM